MADKTLVLMVGGPGAGKSTIMKKLFSELPVVDCDSIKATHQDYDPKNPSGVHEWSQQECAKAVVANISKAESFVYDSTGTNLERMTLYINMAKAVGMKVLAVLVTCDVEIAAKRNRERDRVVPEKMLRERFARLGETWAVIKSMVDEYKVVENN